MLGVADVANLPGNKVLQISHPFPELLELTCLSEHLPILARRPVADICIDQWGNTLLPFPISPFPYMDWATVSNQMHTVFVCLPFCPRQRGLCVFLLMNTFPYILFITEISTFLLQWILRLPYDHLHQRLYILSLTNAKERSNTIFPLASEDQPLKQSACPLPWTGLDQTVSSVTSRDW